MAAKSERPGASLCVAQSSVIPLTCLQMQGPSVPSTVVYADEHTWPNHVVIQGLMYAATGILLAGWSAVKMAGGQERGIGVESSLAQVLCPLTCIQCPAQ